MPLGVAGNAARIEVRGLVTRGATHRGDAEAVGAALDGRLMRIADALRRAIAIGMTVEAARVLEHFAGFGEKRRRARGRVADAREGARRSKLAAYRSARRRRSLGSPGRRDEGRWRQRRHAERQDSERA